MGDSGDGVPNVLSKDDVFVDATARQTPLRKTKLADLMNTDPKDMGEISRGYHRNAAMIDLELIPDDMKQSIIDTYNTECSRKPRSKQDVMNYLIKFKMKNLMESLQDF